MGLAFVALAFYAGGWEAGLVLTAFLAYEGWTLINPFHGDTISEVIWELAERPMIPWVFGVACGYMLAVGVFGPPKQAILCAACFFLMGHWFFQRHEANSNKRTET